MVRHLQADHPDELLVGTATGDDAAVWRLDDERALVSTVDFITPVVDDARTWGRVAAANSVSDVYAMGGRPLFALNLVGWNTDALPTDAARRGAGRRSGHRRRPAASPSSAATRSTTPNRSTAWRSPARSTPTGSSPTPGCAPGQDIILTKPLGVGVLTTAIKADVATDRVSRRRDRLDDAPQRRRGARSPSTRARPAAPT